MLEIDVQPVVKAIQPSTQRTIGILTQKNHSKTQANIPVIMLIKTVTPQ